MRRKWWQWRTAGRHLKVGRSWNCWFPRISLWSVWISLCTEHGGSLFFFCNWTMKMFSRQMYSLLIKSAFLHRILIQSQLVSNHPSKKMEEASPMHGGAKPPYSTSSGCFCHHMIGANFLFGGPNTLPQEESVKKMLCTVLQGEKSKGRTMMWSVRE